LLWLATVVIAISVRVRYGQMERRVLLWLLAVAAEKGIPLPDAAQAFADERFDKLGVRAHRLAIALGQGLPLDRALAATEIRLPNDALVAVRTGCDTGGLAPLLKSAARHAAGIDAAIQGIVGRIVYLLLFMIFTSFVIAFIQIKIVPAFQKIFQDFHQRLPPVTLAMIKGFYGPMHFPVFAALVFILFAGLLLCFLYTLTRYMGLLRWDPPLVRRMSLPLDESLILRSLAESVDAGKPMDATLWVLAKRYPKGYIRRRLRRAAERTNEGTHWCDTLYANRLLSAADAGVLRAAERVGNLSWAMNSTADRLVRRFTTRLLGTMSISFPLVLLAFGAVVFLIAVGLIFPLAQLILHLA
jgi:general secretion pathway protein F